GETSLLETEKATFLPDAENFSLQQLGAHNCMYRFSRSFLTGLESNLYINIKDNKNAGKLVHRIGSIG
ncbi:hypothetical protein ABTG52_06395, partial [Acinetobacter baumannii]